jgi:hypothetical protein
MPTPVAAIRRVTPWRARVTLPLVAALAATALSVGSARANPPLFSSPRPSWGFEVSGGWNSYRLGEFNDSLRSVNQDLGTAFGTIRRGGDFGAALRCWVNPRVLLRLNLEKHIAVARSADIRYDIGPLSLTVGGTYFFPSESRLRIGAGAAAGVSGIRGEFKGSQFQFDTRGSGPELRATGEAMWPIRDGWFVSGSAGARYARVPDVLFGKQGTNTVADFSGFILRVTVGKDGPPPERSR